jgi:hypothetical protein
LETAPISKFLPLTIRLKKHTWHGIFGHLVQGYACNSNRTMEPRSSNTSAEPPSRLVATGSTGHPPRVIRRGPSIGPVLRSQ